MKKWLCVFLLLLLPFQAGWAVAAGYCQHSGSAHEQHFGHHDGHRHSKAVDADGSDSERKAAADSDATHCHGLGTAMLATPVLLPRPLAQAAAMRMAHVDKRAHIPSPPERPQWARHA